MMEKRIKQKRRMNVNKSRKAIALTEIFLMVLSSIAFAFIIGGMGVMSLDGVGAVTTSGSQVPSNPSDGDDHTFSDGTIVRYSSDSGGWIYINGANSGDFYFPPETSGAPAATAQPQQAAVPKSDGTIPTGSQMITIGATSPQGDTSRLPVATAYTQVDAAKAALAGTPEAPGSTFPSPSDYYGKLEVVDSGSVSPPSPVIETYKNPFSDKPFTPQSAWGHFGGNIMEGVTWAGVVLTMTGLFAGFAQSKNTKNMINAIGVAISAGIMAYKTTSGLFSAYNAAAEDGGTVLSDGKIGKVGELGGWQTGISVGVAIVAAYLTYASQYKKEKEKTESIEFKCMTWQAPKGGKDCNKCNDNSLQPCSEYRCRSLGQTCKLINGGTGEDRCIDSAPSDTTSPGIKPWKEAITPGYAYSNVKERPAGESSGTSGMTISYNNGCLPAFTPFEFGIITTDIGDVTQPAQCKIDFNHTTKYDEMDYYFGESNLYEEEHSQAMSLPGTDLLSTLYGSEENESTLDFENGGDYKLYVRCKDGNGNENRDEFVVSFCVDKSPDVTAPIIKAANPPANSPVLYNLDNASIQVYTNEPSECRWSRKDASYINMENQMQCNNEVWEMNAEFLYTCNTVLTGIKNKQENKFYFRCADRSAQNNTMQESYEYSLFGTQPLNIIKVGPNGTISGSTSTVTTTLTVQTDNGYKNGESRCSYSTSNDSGFIEMVNTGTNMHSQPLDLIEGNYTYYYRCIDAGGNIAGNSTNFIIYVDKYAPVVTRAYNFEGKLTIITDEESNCKYSTTSCNFDMNKEGITMPYDKNKVHYSEWKTTQSYYIKCMDEDGNQPNPTECSMIVRPYRVSQE